uniref:Uncharacterized protein n=1 Tax=Anguilla anguilla TaxID=7936 RepID=A0A0E9QA18_ANGAN
MLYNIFNAIKIKNVENVRYKIKFIQTCYNN